MSERPPRHPMTTRRVVYEIDGMRTVPVQRDVEFRRTEAGPLTLDVYRPRSATAALPAVLLVTGYSDPGAAAMLGCRFMEMDAFISWAQLIAASGMVAVTHATGRDPAEDVRAAFNYLRDHAGELGIDAARIGLWACSGHGPNALALLMDAREAVACAAFCYAFTMDLESATDVGEAAAAFRFANAAAGRSIEDVPASVPMLLVRAGKDQFAGANRALDRFVARGLERDLPLTVTNYAGAPHAFDLEADSEATRIVIAQVLEYLRGWLLGPTASARRR